MKELKKQTSLERHDWLQAKKWDDFVRPIRERYKIPVYVAPAVDKNKKG